MRSFRGLQKLSGLRQSRRLREGPDATIYDLNASSSLRARSSRHARCKSQQLHATSEQTALADNELRR
eukprot:5857652-Pyramimonas_sp.AAC.1